MIRVSIDFTPNRIVLHPTMEDWVLGYDLKAGKLYCSLNFGLNWTLLHKFVTPRFFWAVEGHDHSTAVVHMELLDSDGETRYLACLAPYCGEISMDTSINPILPSSLIVQDEYIFVQKQHFDRNELYVSYRRESFKKAHFPDDLHPQNFNILNTNEGQVFVAVHHEKDFVNCYLSEPTGQFYVLTLPNIVAVTVKGRFQVDLYQVRGLPGIYLANQEPSELNLKESGRRTYISFDKGGNWSLIPVPLDMKSQCKSDKLSKCSLHLHLQQMEVLFNVPRILSDENAPGLILAHGTVGEQLSFQDVSVFISRDAGVHWYSAPFHGLHELNILDQGSAITALNASWKTREIYFSCDEGQSWQKHIFADEDVYVDGVLNEPGINTLIVSVYAHKFPSKGWILVKANFSSILTRRCSSEDYESWNPAEEVSKGCILGRKLIFERKKQFSKCNNGRDYERPINITVCQCTKQDFECDFGYERETKEEECVPARWYNPDRPVFDCPENQYFNKSHGYRKVGGDFCVGGVSNHTKYRHVLAKCPVIPPSGLRLSTSKPIIATMSIIKFNLTQNEGSVLSTNYTIDFGDGTIQYFHGPDILNREMSHRYFSHGSYTISVKAENANGSATTRCLVHAEDEIEEFNVESLNGVQTHHPVLFKTAVSGRHMSTSNIGDVHYVWHFGDEKLQLPLLTWKKNVSHVYMEPGAYTATVEAINSVSSAYVQIPLQVYNYIRRIQLTFSSNIDHINRYDQQWRSWLKKRLQERLIDLLHVTADHLIVFVYNEIPPKADVTLLPNNPQSVSDKDTDKLVENLLSLVKERDIDIKWLDSIIKVTGASIQNEISTNKSKTNIIPIAIAAPILALSVVFLAIVFLYYRRKFHRVQRYSFLQARDAADSLLEDDEDDPPLDPNPNFSHIEMTEDQTDSVEGGGGLVNPVLVMMPGRRSQSNLTDPHALRC
ncbi:VPS10 domain-containing receptor SorCS3 [Octopus bimaculoides]|uniref:VPS10 domain-containing receptor SorCS3 n=1 Tax=Octopus bimaculoides TaxID=37653 RepID=UPI0022E517C1|nr:VPS10 domain-containing receptor SorCS3 [Octopus bimaculoides]